MQLRYFSELYLIRKAYNRDILFMAKHISKLTVGVTMISRNDIAFDNLIIMRILITY